MGVLGLFVTLDPRTGMFRVVQAPLHYAHPEIYYRLDGNGGCGWWYPPHLSMRGDGMGAGEGAGEGESDGEGTRWPFDII